MGSAPLPVCEELRRAREAAGLELAEVAAHLRIRSNFLSALEEGRPDALPGITYAIGYVRTYAGFLGLDPETAVRRFKEEAAGLNAKTQLVFPSPAPEGRVPGFTLMLAAALLAGGAYGGWYWMSERDGSLRDLVPNVPERLAQLIEGDAAPLPKATDPATGASVPPQVAGTAGSYAEANPAGVVVPAPRAANVPEPAARVAEPSPDRPDVATQSAPAQVAAIPNPAPEPVQAPSIVTTEAPAIAAPPAADATPQPVTEPAPAPAVPTAETAETPDTTAPPESVTATADAGASRPTAAAPAVPTDEVVPAAPRIAGLIGASEAAVPAGRTAGGAAERVMIRATGDSWVQVRDAEGTALFTRVLREGDIYRVPSQAGLRLATGNAGALEVLVDGAPAPRLGGFGEVVRNVTLDPALLASGTATTSR